MLKHIRLSSKKIVMTMLVLYSGFSFANFQNYETKVAPAALTIAQTTPPNSTPRTERIEIEATRIVNEFVEEFDDFTTSCGVQPDCFTFWMENIRQDLISRTQAEDARQARCSQASTEYSTKDCGARDINPPTDDSNIRFTIAPISPTAQYNYFRPIIREFHTQIFNDASGNTINNFSSVLTQLRNSCDSNLSFPAFNFACKLDADLYFGQSGLSGGLQSFLNSRAGLDAKPNVNGSVCNGIRQRLNADQCGFPT